MGMLPIPTPGSLLRAGQNVHNRVTRGHLADLRRMERVSLDETPLRSLYRYDPEGTESTAAAQGPPVLLVPPLGAPAICFDLRRGCSLVEHLVQAGHRVYLVDYGPIAFDDRALGVEFWVDDVLPQAIAQVSADAGNQPVQLVGWSLGGLFAMLAASAHPHLPVDAVAAIASPVDVTEVPFVAPLRPLASIAGGRVVGTLSRAVGSFPAPVVRWAFQLTSIDTYLTKPLTILANLDDREFLEQIEAVDFLMANMYAYPGRTFGQLFHLLFRANDLARGRLDIDGRRVELSGLVAPVLLIGGQDDVLAPLQAVRRAKDLLTGSPRVRFESVPGGHLGSLTGRRAAGTTWHYLEEFLRSPTGAEAA